LEKFDKVAENPFILKVLEKSDQHQETTTTVQNERKQSRDDDGLEI